MSSADDYNRKIIGPREKYNNNGEEALEKSYGKWRESAQDYDADPDSVPDNWRGGRAGGPQTSYDSDQSVVTANGRRRKRLPRGEYENDQDFLPDQFVGKEHGRTPSHMKESGAERNYANNYEKSCRKACIESKQGCKRAREYGKQRGPHKRSSPQLT
ncbi:hypothetical protein MRX96_030427 [Rhipicephalus microplus]